MADTYRELLHQAVNELIDEHFTKMLYKIAACNIRKEAKGNGRIGMHKDNDRIGTHQEGDN